MPLYTYQLVETTIRTLVVDRETIELADAAAMLGTFEHVLMKGGVQLTDVKTVSTVDNMSAAIVVIEVNDVGEEGATYPVCSPSCANKYIEMNPADGITYHTRNADRSSYNGWQCEVCGEEIGNGQFVKPQ